MSEQNNPLALPWTFTNEGHHGAFVYDSEMRTVAHDYAIARQFPQSQKEEILRFIADAANRTQPLDDDELEEIRQQNASDRRVIESGEFHTFPDVMLKRTVRHIGRLLARIGELDGIIHDARIDTGEVCAGALPPDRLREENASLRGISETLRAMLRTMVFERRHHPQNPQ